MRSKFDAYLNYENYFGEFTNSLKTLSKSIQDYWKNLLKTNKQKECIKYGNTILKKLALMNIVQDKIKKQCGQFLNVVLLSWKLYRDTMNFEAEC